MPVDEKIEDLITLVSALEPKLVAQKMALLIIDMQKYQVRKEGASYKVLSLQVPGVLDYYMDQVKSVVEPNLSELISICREKGIKIIFTKYCSFLEDGSDLTPRNRLQNDLAKNIADDVPYPPVSHSLAELIPSLKPQPEDFIIVKNTSGAFMSTRLDSILRNMGIDTLLITGVVTHFCVLSTAREATDLGFEVIIVEDCCAGWTEQLHEVALKTFALVYGTTMKLKKLKKKLENV
jgi:nicotinamidase-related amidase